MTVAVVLLAASQLLSVIGLVLQHLRIQRLRKTNAEALDLAAANWAKATPDPWAVLEGGPKIASVER